MERQRNWMGLIAIGLAGLALLVALGGHMPFMQPHMAAANTFVAPAAPMQSDQPGVRGQREQRGFVQREQRAHSHHDSQTHHGHGRSQGFFKSLFGVFGLVRGFGQLIAAVLFALLLVKVLNDRRERTES